MDKILIRGLSIDAIVGIYPYEREHEQPLLLDLSKSVLKAAISASPSTMLMSASR